MPEASLLVKLDQLHTIKTGCKIRVLGCVHGYDIENARLTLRDRYPATTKDAPTAIVTIENLVDGLNHELLATGTWLNIMGYVRITPSGMTVSRRAQVTCVEATMLWSAGAVKVEKYHAAVEALQEATKGV
ncbi:hypothetical protein LTR17_015377 [Elasticomyces elasticus]|nr:hypothetical protein LTR17_015377 [Elasticomyces elasticus]